MQANKVYVPQKKESSRFQQDNSQINQIDEKNIHNKLMNADIVQGEYTSSVKVHKENLKNHETIRRLSVLT